MKLFIEKLEKQATLASTREIDLSAVPAKDRLMYLAENGYEFDESKTYRIEVRISTTDDEGYRISPRVFSRELDRAIKNSADPRGDARLADAIYDKFADGLYEGEPYVEVPVTVRGEKLTTSQRVDVICTDNCLKLDSKITQEQFGGENVTETLRAIREMSEDEFNARFVK